MTKYFPYFKFVAVKSEWATERSTSGPPSEHTRWFYASNKL
jgi:hypothetical protein